MSACLICEHKIPEGWYCQEHQKLLEKERDAAKKRRNWWREAFRYVHYRGTIIGFFHNGNGTLKPELITISLNRLPKSKLINLDEYVDGFNRHQVKRLKACVKAWARV